MADAITIYSTSVSANKTVIGHMSKIEMVLKSKNIPYEVVDVAASSDNLQKMRTICNDTTAVPIQIAKGDTHIGDFNAFDDANESGTLTEFLKL